jgi:tetratricopeptide (TPR) repeat protein
MTDPVQEEIACFERGVHELESGGFEQAVESLERALHLNQANGMAGLETEVATVLLILALGKACLEGGRYREATSCFVAALEAHREEGDKEAEMDALASLGHAQMKAAEATEDPEGYAAAGSCFAGEMALAVELNHVEAQAEALMNGSHCFTSAGERDDETVEYIEYTIAFLEEHRGEIDDVEHHLVRNRIRLGLCFNDRGEHANALAPLRHAEEKARSHTGCTCRLRSLRGLVDALEELEDWPACERYTRDAVEHCHATGSSYEPELIGRLGVALAAQRDIAGGLREADRAVALAGARFKADPSTESDLGSALGIKATILNNWAKRFAAAVEPAERSAEITSRIGEEKLLVNRLLMLGGVHMNIGGQSLAVAAEKMRDALQLAEKLGDNPSEAMAHARLGLIYVRRDDSTSAISHYESAIEIYRAIGDYAELSSVLVSLAGVLDLPPGRAVACLTEAQEISSRVVDSAAEAFALRELSRVRRAVGLHEEAAEALHLGLEIVESVRARLATSVERAALLEAHSALYADAAYLAYERNEPLLALRYAEAGRGRLILDQRAEEAAGQVPDPTLRESVGRWPARSGRRHGSSNGWEPNGSTRDAPGATPTGIESRRRPTASRSSCNGSKRSGGRWSPPSLPRTRASPHACPSASIRSGACRRSRSACLGTIRCSWSTCLPTTAACSSA